jgi:hypothetical protein
MPEGPCFNHIWSEILQKDVTPRRADNRVRKVCREYYLVEPGYVFREVPILLSRAMLVGIDEEGCRILIPFRKPCYGTSLYAIDTDREEIARIRSDLGRREIVEPVKRTGTGKKKTKRPTG